MAYLEKKQDELQDGLSYRKAQFLENSLALTNISEKAGAEIETEEFLRRKLRQHSKPALEIAKQTAKSIRGKLPKAFC